MKAKKYRKKPVIIEAVQFDGKNACEIAKWITEGATNKRACTFDVGIIDIYTLEGKMTALKGDYVIKGVKGEFYPCKPDIFDLTYEEIDPRNIITSEEWNSYVADSYIFDTNAPVEEKPSDISFASLQKMHDLIDKSKREFLELNKICFIDRSEVFEELEDYLTEFIHDYKTPIGMVQANYLGIGLMHLHTDAEEFDQYHQSLLIAHGYDVPKEEGIYFLFIDKTWQKLQEKNDEHE